MILENILNFIAYIFIFRQIVRIVNFLLDFILSGPNLIKRYGNGWAIVTGATDGIGKEFCI